MSNNSSITNCDVLVLGGGMSGLALACHIADYNDLYSDQEKDTWVIEPRVKYLSDKTWCFWQQDANLFDSAVTHRWNRWLIKSGDNTHICRSSELDYVMVDSGRYYAIAQERLTRSTSVNLLTGTRAEALQIGQTQITVDCDDVQFKADYVYDTRPKEIPFGTLLQHFVGWEIETDQDVFDTHTVTLMDFQASNDDDIHFFYVLPFTKRHALVETTHFSKKSLEDKIYLEELTHYITTELGIGEWRILREERGIIPMPKKPPNPEQRAHYNVIPFGLYADTAKPSTGYCYPHAQHQAKQHASRLFAGTAHQVTAVRNPVAQWLDHVFISFLEHQPAHAASTFIRLFKRVPEPVLIRFLSDNAKITDYLKVIAAMPKFLFICEAFRCAKNL